MYVFLFIYITFNNIQNSVARRFGPENQDYRKKTEFARLSFDIDAGTRYIYIYIPLLLLTHIV